MPKRLLILFLCWIAAAPCRAQYTAFSYPWQASLWHNPAAAAGTHAHHAQMSYRHRAPRLEGGIAGMYVQYAHTWQQARTALGSWAMLEQAGSGRFRQQAVALSLTHFVPLHKSVIWRLSLEGSYLQQTHGFGQYTFGDQLSIWGNTGQASAESFPDERLHAWNLHAATLLHTPSFWIGASARYLNQALLRGSGAAYRLPVYWQAQAGARLDLPAYRRTAALLPWASYRRYAAYQSLDVGIWGILSPLQAGISVESLPIDGGNDSRLFLHAGIDYEGYRFIYSFGSPVGAQALAGHVHEVGFSVRFGESARRSYSRSPLPRLPYEPSP
ncbi:MAG: hypothetical protein KatS3mg033_1947 [Thermonema sp.]|uniref:type IX secretion system membrane protein PorP/SprF n=1 Tax=Thermonema sp. TaxID=2231181 RepID=UPI0021DC8988|nr:type IX secretion system membrane protein PorP/SprF [Thermonema sp.]GIV40147.1 MAG: hypothetical protein KatS3mg033_1947 [Thermonema sp.]